MGEVIGYARVSTTDQHLDTQLARLTAAGCTRIYQEKVSGRSRENRTELQNMLAFVREGDVVVVVKLDRLARSTRDLLNTAHDLSESGVQLRILDLGVDTSTPVGRMFFTTMAGIAEFERDIIAERRDAGIAENKGKLRPNGRPKYAGRVATIDAAEVLRRRRAGERPSGIARDMAISQSSVFRIIREAARRPTPRLVSMGGSK